MSKVQPGFYLVSFAKSDTSLLGFGSQEVLVSAPKEPKVFLDLVKNEIGKGNTFEKFVIIAVSKLA